MKTRRFVALAISLFGTVFCAAAVSAAEQALPAPSEFEVAHRPGITLADVARTHAKFFNQATGVIAIQRRDHADIPCASPTTNRTALRSDDSIIIPIKNGSIVLGLYPASQHKQ